MVAQLGHVGPRQAGVQRAFPAPPVARARQQRPAGLANNGEAVAPIRRRCRVQPQLMPAAAVAQQQLHIGQCQRRGGALLVQPAQRAAAHQDLVLAEDPVGGVVGAQRGGLGAEQQSAHVQPAGGVAPHVEPGILDQQLGEPQLQAQQRRHRQRGLHPRQAQRLAAGGVAQHHVLQLEAGQPATALRSQLPDLHRMPQCPRGQHFHPRAPFIQTRQNPGMQADPGRHSSGHTCQDQAPCNKPGPATEGAQPARPGWAPPPAGRLAHRS